MKGTEGGRTHYHKNRGGERETARVCARLRLSGRTEKDDEREVDDGTGDIGTLVAVQKLGVWERKSCR